jgi:hypothetical protein
MDGDRELSSEVGWNSTDPSFSPRALTWDRCYDFLKIFSPKNSAKKIGVFDSKQSKIMKNFDHNIGF